jgi:hypothetical protein
MVAIEATVGIGDRIGEGVPRAISKVDQPDYLKSFCGLAEEAHIYQCAHIC